MYRILTCIFLLVFALGVRAYDSIRVHTSMVGFGKINQLDTYLSPLQYRGSQIRFLQENEKNITLLSHELTMQNLIQCYASYSKNKTHDSSYLGGGLQWNMAMFKSWDILSNFQMFAGPQVGALAGMIYSTHSGNNPAQGRLAMELGISGGCKFYKRIGNKDWLLRYQANLPIVGVLFSPEYGESYYEIFSLGHGGWHNVKSTSPFSAFTIEQTLMLEIPFRSNSLRLGIESICRQTSVNSIKTHDWTHLFLIGYTHRLKPIVK